MYECRVGSDEFAGDFAQGPPRPTVVSFQHTNRIYFYQVHYAALYPGP